MQEMQTQYTRLDVNQDKKVRHSYLRYTAAILLYILYCVIKVWFCIRSNFCTFLGEKGY